MKVLILAGGFGSRLGEETDVRPKPMVEIGGKPILWHIMKLYSYHGFNDFVILLGYKGYVIKEYFANYFLHQSNVTIDLRDGSMEVLNNKSEPWKVSLLDTGYATMTGSRVKKAKSIVGDEPFMLTYGDGVTDLNIKDLLRFHMSHGKIGTVTGVFPPSRYGELLIREDRVTSFAEKPEVHVNSISGGYFVYSRKFFSYLEDDDSCVLEKEPLERLTVDGELMVFNHKGFWQCMDTHRDLKYLLELWTKGNAPWKVW